MAAASAAAPMASLLMVAHSAPMKCLFCVCAIVATIIAVLVRLEKLVFSDLHSTAYSFSFVSM
eukprot:5466584-Amphidinium_carterae.1